MEKITKREMYETIKAMNGATDAIIAFCDKEIAALERKAAKARENAAKKRAEGDDLKDAIKNILTSDFQTIKDIMAELEADFEDISTNKVAYRLSSLEKGGFAAKENISVEGTDGKKAKRMAYKLV